MQTAGLVLDLYDNPRDLKTIFPSVDVIPDSVKVAHHLSPDELAKLPDDVFALVLMDNGDRLRKFACVDEGNTILNLGYFFLHGHKLPEDAQHRAAENLKVACAWYNIEVPEELEKVALGLGTVLTAATLPSLAKGTAGQIRDNLAATNLANGTVMPSHQQRAVGSMLKSAEVSGTDLAPAQPAGDLAAAVARGKPGSTSTSVSKTAAMNPYVDVTGRGASVKIAMAAPTYSAYHGNYPLDSFVQVQRASDYFNDNYRAMEPEMRHEYAVNMVKRASALGIRVSDEAAAYGSTSFGSETQIKIAADTRRPHITEKQAGVLDQLIEQRFTLGPEAFCSALEEFDKIAGIDWRYDQSVMDPYISTYGTKTASDEGDSWTAGNDYVTKAQIENYAITGFHTLKHDYGDDFAKEFKKDPWGIFSSLPVDQKRRLARAASDNSETGMKDVD